MERRYPPVKIVDTLWAQAAKMVQPPQLAIVIVSEAGGVCAFRHNCLAGLPDLAGVLHAFADQLKDARGVIAEARAPSIAELQAKVVEVNRGLDLLLAERDKAMEAWTAAVALDAERS